MRKYVLQALLFCSALALISWGFKGHRAIATIAEKHLTTNTANVVSIYLKGESMASVSTWADENRDKTTASWHYLNLPAGLNHEQFADAVSKLGNDNVYTAILKVEANLKDKTLSAEQKNEGLKYLIHLVGDAHQPMHVSRKEDKGGNTIQVQFDGKGTNLHALWDSKLIDHEGLSEAEMVAKYDWANPTQIKKWQADSPMEWLWESYQISSELYEDVKSGENIDEAYYKRYIPTIHLRIEQAGIRLAGELNRLFNEEKVKVTRVTLTPPPPIGGSSKAIPAKLEDVKNLIGKDIRVRGKVYSSKDIGSMVLINLGAAYPNQSLTVALKGNAKYLASQIEGKTINVEGTVIEFKGKPEMVISDPDRLVIEK